MTIRVEKPSSDFRQYNEESTDLEKDGVAKLYYQNHTLQTFEHSSKQTQILTERLFKGEGEQYKLTLWEAMSLLDNLVDESDPDTSNAQTQHAFQSAEAARELYPDDKALHFTCLIHDMGKVLCLHPQQKLEQWSVVGDTFILGLPFVQSIVHSKLFAHNPDNQIEKFQSNELGIYKEGIGFDNCVFSFGHDEYLYQVLKANGTTLPERYLRVIRYHSFYPWHNARDATYEKLANDEDRSILFDDIKKFNQFDLYSKSHELVDIDKVRPYYEDLAREFLPNEELRW